MGPRDSRQKSEAATDTGDTESAQVPSPRLVSSLFLQLLISPPKHMSRHLLALPGTSSPSLDICMHCADRHTCSLVRVQTLHWPFRLSAEAHLPDVPSLLSPWALSSTSGQSAYYP